MLQLREAFHFNRPFKKRQLWETLNYDSLFGFVQRESHGLKQLREKFAIFPAIFKNTIACKQYIGSVMEENAEK